MKWTCSREKSLLARNIINKKIIPILEKYRINMSLECPFHPERDALWWPNEKHQIWSHSSLENSWKCPFCGEKFICAEGLSFHWDKVHQSYTHTQNDGVCIGDYCDILRCDVLSFEKFHKNNYIIEGVCDASYMNMLEEKCIQIINQCIGIIDLSDKHVKDIRDDLSSAICSYLNCEHFWDNNFKELRNMPLYIRVLIGSIMISGFCVCYYIIWIIFESPLLLKPTSIKRLPAPIHPTPIVERPQNLIIVPPSRPPSRPASRPQIFITSQRDSPYSTSSRSSHQLKKSRSNEEDERYDVIKDQIEIISQKNYVHLDKFDRRSRKIKSTYSESRSQPPSNPQSPRPPSTQSTPYR